MVDILALNRSAQSRVLNTLRVASVLFLFSVAASAAGEKTACPPVAQKPTPEMLQAGARNTSDRGFLWRIKKNGRTSYLYGTIHAAKFDWMFPGPVVKQALKLTDTVALELDVMDQDIQSRMAKGMVSQHGSILSKSLSRRMRQQAESACIPYDAIAKYTPEMQITFLTVMAGRWDGLDASYAIDGVLAGLGHSANKNVVSLETPEAQLQMLQKKDAKETASFVEDGLVELETGRARNTFAKIAKVWANADYDALENYSEWCDCLNTDGEREMMKRLLDGRNPNLARRIDDLHESGKQVFAAVGSLHMSGSTGLPIQMMKLGYSVERIELNRR